MDIFIFDDLKLLLIFDDLKRQHCHHRASVWHGCSRTDSGTLAPRLPRLKKSDGPDRSTKNAVWAEGGGGRDTIQGLWVFSQMYSLHFEVACFSGKQA